MKKSKKNVKVTFPSTVNCVGELVGMIYRETGSKKSVFIHAFKKLPELYVSGDGKQIIVIGGGFKYSKKRGFEG